MGSSNSKTTATDKITAFKNYLKTKTEPASRKIYPEPGSEYLAEVSENKDGKRRRRSRSSSPKRKIKKKSRSPKRK